MGKLAVGLMSGTSVDGIDAALVDIEGFGLETVVQLRHFINFPIEDNIKEEILRCMGTEKSHTALVCSLNFKLGKLFAEAVIELCREAKVKLEDIDFIGSHGQTVHHLPKNEGAYVKSTLQIGEAAVIAYETQSLVVSNFRTMDMAAGGEGAPLVPYTEYLLYRRVDKGIALQNIGGIGNVTVIPKGCELNEVFAFDTGPGNMIIDELCRQLKGVPFDEGGKWGEAGKVHKDIAESWLEHEFFMNEPPKSTGREMFGATYTDRLIKEHGNMSAEDLIATATYFTAASIADAYKRFVFPKEEVKEIILGGGGSYNKTLVRMLQELLPGKRVITQEEIGLSSDAKEAVAFAILANETLNSMPSNLPNATGASENVILGSITKPPIAKKQHMNEGDIMDLKKIMTERRNPDTYNLDELSSFEIVQKINNEDKLVPVAVEKILPTIALVVDKIVSAFEKGGRLIYAGAGTSGRLGILDASECPPTYGTPDEQVIALIAGGEEAIQFAQEDVEDDAELGGQDIVTLNVSDKDIVVGIAASGRTPYTVGAMKEAKKRGAVVAAVVCSPDSIMEEVADYGMVAEVGPEVVTGSTRMKAGTAQKLILNMLTSAAMVRMGKVYSNLMVDVMPSNEKLRERAKLIVAEAAEVSIGEADFALKQYGSAKGAILSLLTGIKDEDEVARLIQQNNGHLRRAILDSSSK